MTKLLAFALCFVMGITAQAQEKIFIGNSSNGNKYYIYPSTIQKYKSYLKVWKETQYAIPERIPSVKEYSVDKVQLLIDCNGMRIVPIIVNLYTKSGNSVHSSKISDWQAEMDLTYMPPGSMGWNMIEGTCNYYKNKK